MQLSWNTPFALSVCAQEWNFTEAIVEDISDHVVFKMKGPVSMSDCVVWKIDCPTMNRNSVPKISNLIDLKYQTLYILKVMFYQTISILICNPDLILFKLMGKSYMMSISFDIVLT